MSEFREEVEISTARFPDAIHLGGEEAEKLKTSLKEAVQSQDMGRVEKATAEIANSKTSVLQQVDLSGGLEAYLKLLNGLEANRKAAESGGDAEKTELLKSEAALVGVLVLEQSIDTLVNLTKGELVAKEGDLNQFAEDWNSASLEHRSVYAGAIEVLVKDPGYAKVFETYFNGKSGIHTEAEEK